MVGSRDLQPSDAPYFRRVFVDNQFKTPLQLPPSSTDLSSKTAIVTGANVGLGLEACRQLLDIKLGHLVLAVRSTQRGEEAARELRAKYPRATIEVSVLDMSNYESIQSFVQRCNNLPRLDIAILNAGVRPFKRNVNPATNHEESLQVNYISTVLLAILLLPVIKRLHSPGSPGRITIVGAALALVAKLPPAASDKKASIFAALDDPKAYNSEEHYRATKLLTHMFLWKLVDYVSADDLVVNIGDPAFVKGTRLTRGMPGPMTPMVALFGAIAGRTPQMGASCIIDAAVTQGRDSHGAFVMSYRVHP